jgi:hypothetical protein
MRCCKRLHLLHRKGAVNARSGRGWDWRSGKRAWRPLFGSLTAAKAAPTCLYVFWMRLFGKMDSAICDYGIKSGTQVPKRYLICRHHQKLIGQVNKLRGVPLCRRSSRPFLVDGLPGKTRLCP